MLLVTGDVKPDAAVVPLSALESIVIDAELFVAVAESTEPTLRAPDVLLLVPVESTLKNVLRVPVSVLSLPKMSAEVFAPPENKSIVWLWEPADDVVEVSVATSHV